MVKILWKKVFPISTAFLWCYSHSPVGSPGHWFWPSSKRRGVYKHMSAYWEQKGLFVTQSGRCSHPIRSKRSSTWPLPAVLHPYFHASGTLPWQWTHASLWSVLTTTPWLGHHDPGHARSPMVGRGKVGALGQRAGSQPMRCLSWEKLLEHWP